MVGRSTAAAALGPPCWLSGLEESRSSVVELWNSTSEELEGAGEEDAAGREGVREGVGLWGIKPREGGPGEGWGEGEGAGEGGMTLGGGCWGI